jgi:hypothetical protein
MSYIKILFGDDIGKKRKKSSAGNQGNSIIS